MREQTETPQIKRGDLVRLKSGGPWMTVSYSDDGIRCQWFHDGELHEGVFAPEQLFRGRDVIGDVKFFGRDTLNFEVGGGRF